MSWEFETILAHTLQFLAIVFGLIQIHHLDKASKLLLLYILLSLIFESIATYQAVKYHNNHAILNIFAPIEFIIICIYFGFAISKLNWKGTLLIILVSVLVWIVTNRFYPVTQTYNTAFLVYESIGTIALCLFYYLDLLNVDDSRGVSSSFWFTAFLLVFWSFTFFYWLLGFTVQLNLGSTGNWLGKMIWVINVICYSGFGLVFLFYRKLSKVE